MKIGDIVVVLGKMDERIREKTKDGLIKGTLFQILYDNQVCVILENNDLWVGSIRDVILANEQD